MRARRNPALETVSIPRVEMDTQTALLALADRALGLVMDAGPQGELALLDLERAYILARAAIRNEIDSHAARGLPIAQTRRPSRPRGVIITGVVP